MLVIEHVVEGLANLLHCGEQLGLLDEEPLRAAVLRVALHNAAILEVAVARILEVLVEGGLEPGQSVVIFPIGAALLPDSLPGLLASHSDFVQQDVVDAAFFELFHVGHSFQDVDISDPVVRSRLVEGEHVINELLVDEHVCIKDVEQGRILFKRTPWVRLFVSLNWSARFSLGFALLGVSLLESLLLDSPHHL